MGGAAGLYVTLITLDLSGGSAQPALTCDQLVGHRECFTDKIEDGRCVLC